MMKSSWSNGIQSSPRWMLALRLRKLSTASPSSAPMLIEKTSGIIIGNPSKFVMLSCAKSLSMRKELMSGAAVDRAKPPVIPMSVPMMSPCHVFPSPRIRRPSFHVFPPSIGLPPPVRRALALAMYAGVIIQNDWMRRISKSIVVGYEQSL